MTEMEPAAVWPDAIRKSTRRQAFLIVIAAAIPSTMYLVFIAHFARNGIYWDGWSLVPIVDNAIHHHLDWSQLWKQHNENREMFPYLIVAGIGALTHLNTVVIIYASAVLFITSFLLLLGSYKSYAGKQVTPLQTLLVGLVWFSIVDVQNALWAFQIAWYVVLLCVFALIFVFSRPRVSKVSLIVALIVAAIASFSSLQGLLVWPLGLFCIVWRLRGRRKLLIPAGVWVVAAIGAVVLYFHHYQFGASSTGGGSMSYALHHPTLAGQYVLIMVGNVIPTASSERQLHEIIGAILVILALVAVVGSFSTWRATDALPLPTAMIIFALLFDLAIALGRSSFGLLDAEQSNRYTMANLLIVLALVITVFAIPRSRWAHRRRNAKLPLLKIAAIGGLVLVLVQTGVSTDVGLQSAGNWRHRIEAGDIVLVQLDHLPEPKRSTLFQSYVFPSLAAADDYNWLRMVRRDHLGELAPSTAAIYSRMKPPQPPPPSP